MFVVLGMVVLVAGCVKEKKYQFAEGQVYGTFYHVSYHSPEDLHREIRAEMEKVNVSLSMFNPESVIAKINRGESDETDSLFRKMFVKALNVNRATAGAFDITVAPLVNAWGFGFKNDTFPSPRKIDSLLQFVGMDKLSLDGDRIVKATPGVEMDASSIAKGLGTDLVAEFFDRKGISDYMVEIGGEIRVKGMNAKRKPWTVGIEKPIDDASGQEREISIVVGFTSGALATSGNYRKFYIHEGKKYAHTIDPRSGSPVQREILSASVYTDSCMVADAYATAFMVIGLEAAKELVDKTPGLEACFMYERDGSMETWMSEGFEKLVVRK